MGLPVKKRNLFYRNRITFDSNPRLSGTLQTVAEAVFPFCGIRRMHEEIY